MARRCNHRSASEKLCLICGAIHRMKWEAAYAKHLRRLKRQARKEGPKSLLAELPKEKTRNATTIAKRLALAREALDRRRTG